MKPFTLAINAGGKSSRMGTDKAFVSIGGQTILARLVARTRALGQAESLLIANAPERYQGFGWPVYPDALPEGGSLGGIYSALHYSRQPFTLVLACDMPFVSTALLRYLLSLLEEAPYDVIVPRVAGYPEGLHAVYAQTCLPVIATRLAARQLKVIGFYEAVRVRYVDEAEYQTLDGAEHAFVNVNTPEELQQAQRLAQEID